MLVIESVVVTVVVVTVGIVCAAVTESALEAAVLLVLLEQELNKAAAAKIVKICFIMLVCMFYSKVYFSVKNAS